MISLSLTVSATSLSAIAPTFTTAIAKFEIIGRVINGEGWQEDCGILLGLTIIVIAIAIVPPFSHVLTDIDKRFTPTIRVSTSMIN